MYGSLKKPCTCWESNLGLTVLQPETLPPCQMALTVASVLLIALFNNVNSTAKRNFKPNPNSRDNRTVFTIIKCTAARINPASAGNRTWVSLFSNHKLYPAKWSSVVIMVVFSYVNLTAGRNFNFKPDLTLIQATT